VSRGEGEGDVPPIAQAVADFQAGVDRERSFRRIVDRFYPPVRRYFARKTPAEDSLDLTQETFLSLYRGLDGFRGEAQLSTWVFKIARTTHIRWLRRQAREGDRPGRATDPTTSAVVWEDQEPVVVDSKPPPLVRILRQEDLGRLREAVEELPEKMRKCLVLRVYQDLKYQEIADFMGISIQTVKAHLSQARQKLRHKLGAAFTGIDFERSDE